MKVTSRKRRGLAVVKPEIAEESRTVPTVLSPVLLKTKISRKGMAEYLENVLTVYAPHLIPEFMKTLMSGTVHGDRDMMKMAAEIFGLTQNKGGIVINNINQNAAVALSSASSRSFDAMVRARDERRRAEEASARDAEFQVAED